ncbi:hypothetical protein GALL_380810 [mine drainage metagenome]|uniref:DUF3576 domain-containing protein n=1 Tax=mine drainage metagenome TaxID=410659 RepID=A0A1J5QW92_9ZZZZ
MSIARTLRAGILSGSFLALAACGGGQSADPSAVGAATDPAVSAIGPGRSAIKTSGTLGRLFGKKIDPNVSVHVNKYIWNAALDVLNFLPIESIDPFTGVIVTGYGTPPGGGRPYRATIYVQDPALDARSLNVALQSRGGPVSADTVRAVEDAILTRARQMRIADGKL